MKEKNEIEAIAYHEAAHAVFDIEYGYGVKRVTIIPDGLCEVENPSKCYCDLDLFKKCNGVVAEIKNKSKDSIFGFWKGIPDEAKNLLYCLYAGSIAQLKFEGKNIEFSKRDSSDDICNASVIIFMYSKDWENPKLIELEEQKLFNQTISEVDKRWNEIKAVANVLMEKKRLTGDEVEKIIKAQVIY